MISAIQLRKTLSIQSKQLFIFHKDAKNAKNARKERSSIILITIKVSLFLLRRNPLLATQPILSSPLKIRFPGSLEADITCFVACLHVLLAEEFADDDVSTAIGLFAILDKRLERSDAGLKLSLVAAGSALACVARSVFAYTISNTVTVLAGVEQHAKSGFAVSTCSAGFLVVSFEAFGKSPVDDESNVVLIDAHSKGGCSDYDVETLDIVDPIVLAFGSFVGTETCVVWGSADTLVPKPRGQRLAVGAKRDIDDPRYSIWTLLAGRELIADFLGAARVRHSASVYALQKI